MTTGRVIPGFRPASPLMDGFGLTVIGFLVGLSLFS